MCRGLALAARVTHSFFISSLVQKRRKKKKETLVDSRLPPSLSVQTHIGEMKTKWAGEMFRGSDREIRDKAEKRKPFCVSTGHWHNNPPLPSREGNDLCVHPQCVDLCLSCRGQVGHARAVSVCESGSPLRDQGLWGLRDGSPLLLVHIFLWGYLDCIAQAKK